MTTGGEGGMLTIDDEDLWRRAWEYKDHGKSYDAVYNREHPPGFRWLHESFGTNWRLTEMQSAIGRAQLAKLPEWTGIRNRHSAILTEGFSRIPALRVTIPPPGIGHAYYKYYVFVRPELLHNSKFKIHLGPLRSNPTLNCRDNIMEAINAEGIPCFSGSCSEIYREKAFIDAGYGPAGYLPVARDLGETSLMFLVHPTLSNADMHDTIAAVEKVMSHPQKPVRQIV